MTTPAFDTCNPGRGSWNRQLARWVRGDDPSSIPGPEPQRVASEAVPNIRHCVAAGDYHTIMRTPLFYSQSSAGPSFNAWMANMLAGSPGWTNAACPTCLIPVSCP